ncbi:nose resistant to fluoxetine protein 6-like [Frankliniella occidentalis]|uniref:Nose resistant to fluoxetine protein 6-like n=1 Tax=Frankliniella occidentalis TaxID=133901 RepID=A0A9C6WYG8_FRAOC|nr:nose resistant to fluoxetine protein 6-like [Frankliniella occidentalis]
MNYCSSGRSYQPSMRAVLVVALSASCLAVSTTLASPLPPSTGGPARQDARHVLKGGAVYTHESLRKFASVWGHDSAAHGVDYIQVSALRRLDLMQALHDSTRSERCVEALKEVIEARAQLKMWALQMDYSSVALPEAVLSGRMSHLGDFDACIGALDAMYCLVDVEIRPMSAVGAHPHRLDEKSPFDFSNGSNATLWDVLRTSGNRRRYRRDWQQWAMCLPAECGRRGALSDLQKNPKAHHGLADLSHHLGEALASAVNPIGEALGVQLRLHIEPTDCYNPPSPGDPNYSPLYRPLFLFGSFFILLFPALTIAASVKEMWFNNRADKAGFFILTFSIRNNTIKLLRKQETEIHAIQGIRVLATIGVIAGHRAYFPLIGPVLNPAWFEPTFRAPIEMVFINGHIIVASFFVISAFLEARSWLKVFDEMVQISASYVILSLVSRYLRLLPALAVMVAFEALWLEHLGSGPIWNQTVVKIASESCQTHWWTNLLFINNYVHPGCLLHTWFLAAVMQMSMVAPLVMLAAHRCSRRWKAQAALLPPLLSLAVASTVLYICTAAQGLLPATANVPMFMRGANMLFDANFVNQYLPAHTNAIPFTVGLVSGTLLYILSIKQWALSMAMRRYLFLSIPIGLALMIITVMLGMVYLMYEAQQPWLESLWAPARLITFSVAVACIIVSCALGCGGPFGRFLSCRPLIALGRLTYCVFLVHQSLITATSGAARQPLFLSWFSFIHAVTGDLFWSLIFGLLLHLCVEAPMVNVLKTAMAALAAYQVPVLGGLDHAGLPASHDVVTRF